jgi:hypothetical protein
MPIVLPGRTDRGGSQRLSSLPVKGSLSVKGLLSITGMNKR